MGNDETNAEHHEYVDARALSAIVLKSPAVMSVLKGAKGLAHVTANEIEAAIALWHTSDWYSEEDLVGDLNNYTIARFKNYIDVTLKASNPLLSSILQVLYSILHSEAPAERLFSVMGNIVDDTRTRLTVDNAFAITQAKLILNAGSFATTMQQNKLLLDEDKKELAEEPVVVDDDDDDG